MAPSATNGDASNYPTPGAGLSADDFALYDRQIRLWGAQAQERIRTAHVLLISLRALGTEIAKNLTLAGIRSLSIIDEDLVTEEDLGSQYFLREEDIGTQRAQAAIPRIQELNPRVKVMSDGSLQDLLTKDQNYFAAFDCVIACDLDFISLSIINTTVRFAGKPFYAAGMHGFFGFIFADLVGHQFVVEREKPNVATSVGSETTTRSVLSVTCKKDLNGKVVEVVEKQESYCPLLLANSAELPKDVLNNRRKMKGVPALLPCLRALFEFQRSYVRLPDPNTRQDLVAFTSLATAKSRELKLPAETLRADFLRTFIHNIGAEMVPVAAFVGGRLSEDVINVIGKREQPIQNFALFDGENLEGKIYCLYTPPPEVALAGQGLNGLASIPGVIPMDMDPSVGMASVNTSAMPIMSMDSMNGLAMGSYLDNGTQQIQPEQMNFEQTISEQTSAEQTTAEPMTAEQPAVNQT